MKPPQYPLSHHQEEPLPEGSQGDSTNIVINEVQLVLAEKRTSLAAMRTGIAVFALPLSVLSVLVATSKYYDIIRTLSFHFCSFVRRSFSWAPILS
jgi:uncharacterized membrane protein YkgB